MQDRNQLNKLKPVFPVLYLCIFINTIVRMYLNYIAGESPPIVNGVVGVNNQQVVLIVIYIFAFFLCVYDVVYYARLEVFEYSHRPEDVIPPPISIVEYLIRFILVGIVTLKIVDYCNVLNDLFVFSAIVCFLISFWLIYLKLFKIARVTFIDLAPNILIFILSLLAAYYASAPERQIENAIIVLIVIFLLSILLASGVIYVAYRFGKDLYIIAQEFLAQWGIQQTSSKNKEESS